MPKQQNQNKPGSNDRFLIDYLRRLRRLNEFDIEVPQADIKEVIKDPRQYALDFIELEFAKNLPKFIKSYNNGFTFGKKNK